MKKSKFDIVYENVKADLLKRLCLEESEEDIKNKLAAEEGETEVATEEDEVATEEANEDKEDEVATEEDELATEEDEVATEEDEEKDPALAKEFLDNMQIDAKGAACGNDVKVSGI